MLPPVGWPGSSNPAGTTTWTARVVLVLHSACRTEPASSSRSSWIAPAANPSPLLPRNTEKLGVRIDPRQQSTSIVADSAGAGAGDRLSRGRVCGPGELHAGSRDPEAGSPRPDRAGRPGA